MDNFLVKNPIKHISKKSSAALKLTSCSSTRACGWSDSLCAASSYGLGLPLWTSMDIAGFLHPSSPHTCAAEEPSVEVGEGWRTCEPCRRR